MSSIKSWIRMIKSQYGLKSDLTWNPDIAEVTEAPIEEKRTFTQEEMHQLATLLLKGNDDQVAWAARSMIANDLRGFIPWLFSVADGRVTKEIDRRNTAVSVLGMFGGPDVVNGLLNLKKPIELYPRVCLALGLCGDERALGFLLKTAKDGLPFSFSWSGSYAESGYFGVLARAYTLISIGMINQPGTIQPLVLDSFMELVQTDYGNTQDHPVMGTGWLALGLEIAVTANQASKNRKVRAAGAYVMVDPQCSLFDMIEMPPDVMRVWMLQLRLMILRLMLGDHGTQPMIACWPHLKQTIQKLMFAIPMLFYEEPNKTLYDCVYEGLRSKNKLERILAADGAVKTSRHTNDPTLMQFVAYGLKDPDKTVVGATAASVLVNDLECYIPAALELTRSPVPDVRLALLYPMFQRAQAGDPQFAQILMMMCQDPDRTVNTTARELYNIYLHPDSA